MALRENFGDAHIKLKTIKLTRHFFAGCNTVVWLLNTVQSLYNIIKLFCEYVKSQAHKITIYTCKHNGHSNVKIIICTARPSFTSPHVGYECTVCIRIYWQTHIP